MEDCSPEWLAAAQLVAGIAGENIDDRNRPFIEKNSTFLYHTALVLKVKREYRIPDSIMEMLLGSMWDLMVVIANSRVDDGDAPPAEDLDLS